MKVFKNGTIYTVNGIDWDKKPADTLVTDDDGRIIYVGSAEGAPTDDADTVTDLDGAVVLPGFIDSHVHVPGNSLTKLFEVDLFETHSKEEIREGVRCFINRNPQSRDLFGTGFDMSTVDENGNTPCAAWIDDICGDRVAVLQSNDMHSVLLNTKAMELIGILDADWNYDGMGRIHVDGSGRPTGLATDIWDIDLPKHVYSAGEVKAAIKDFEEQMLEWGYTSIMSVAPFAKGLPIETYEVMETTGFRLNTNGAVLIRPDQEEERMEQLISLRRHLAGSDIKIATAKYMIDGVIEGNTACLCEEYDNRPGFCGESIWEYEELVSSFRSAIRNGFQIHTHTIGDAAVKMTLDAIAEAQRTEKDYRHRHVLTHLQLVDPEDFCKFRDNRLIACVQTFWHYKEPGYYDSIEIPALGQKRAEKMYPLKSLKEGGALLTASGDYPVSPVNNPLLGIQMGVTRNAWESEKEDFDDPEYLLGIEERVSIKDMIEAYTVNGAYQLFREDAVGSLEKGKHADFILLDGDPFRTSPMEIHEIKVLRTYLKGEAVYEAGGM